MGFSIEATGANAEEIEYWNGPQGLNWVKQNDLTDLMYDPFGARAIACAELKAGEKVLEVGCGCGKTTGALAAAVQPEGFVTAMDVSAPMLEVARQRSGAYASNVEFVCADAASFAFEPETYDLLFSQQVVHDPDRDC